MNKLEVHTPSVQLPPNSEAESNLSIPWVPSERSRRLIVLIPEDVDCSRVTRRIWELANTTGSTVQLLGLCRNTADEMSLRRELVTISALIQDAKIAVEIKIEIGYNWLKAVKNNYQDGDMIVCIAEQPIGIRRQPLSQLLESTMRAPVYILSKIQNSKRQPNFLPKMIVAWSGFAAIMIGFFILQVKVIQMSKDGFQTLMLLLLLIPEFWFIKIWNSLFS
jgi:hypothetical protein